MDPSYDHLPDITYVCAFCMKAGVHFSLFCPENWTVSSMHHIRQAKGIIGNDGVPIRRGQETSRGIHQHRSLGHARGSDSHCGEVSQLFGPYRGLKRPSVWEVPKRKAPTLKDDGRLSFQLSSDDEFESTTEAPKPISRRVLEYKGVDEMKDHSATADSFLTLLSRPSSINKLDGEKAPNQIAKVPNVDSEQPTPVHAELLNELFKNPSEVANKRKPRLTAMDMWDISDTVKPETVEDGEYTRVMGFSGPVSDSKMLLQHSRSQVITAESLEAGVLADETPEDNQGGPNGDCDLIDKVLRFLSEGN
jgi:hypothetical protein